ncbi:MAG: NADH-quinone oxidoreductase subunit L, partial [Catenulispora sp.]|nr:NADH-quinone oxidoreductase subunit L [Catenulispora sp.]
DKIIEAAFSKGGTSGWILGGAALLGALITAFYMTRMVIMTFFGEKRWVEDADGHEPHPHESPLNMAAPMLLLAVGSVAAGFLFSWHDSFVKWLEPVVGPREEGKLPSGLSTATLTVVTLAAVAVGVAIAILKYGTRKVPAVAPRGSFVTVAARKDLYGDAFNEAALMRPGQYLTRTLVYTDNRGVDGAINGLAALVGGTSGRLRRLQNGFVRSYALSMFGGAAALVAAILFAKL